VAANGNTVPRWEVRSLINSLDKGKYMAIVHVDIDLAKNVLAVHGVDEAGTDRACCKPLPPRAACVFGGGAERAMHCDIVVPGVGCTQRMVLACVDASLEAALLLKREANELLFADRDQPEGMQAFIDKRKPQFEGRTKPR
jgi:hypothetical protein